MKFYLIVAKGKHQEAIAAYTDAIWIGRERVFFCIERDIHERSLPAFRVPEHPPDVRRQLRETTAPAPTSPMPPAGPSTRSRTNGPRTTTARWS